MAVRLPGSHGGLARHLRLLVLPVQALRLALTSLDGLRIRNARSDNRGALDAVTLAAYEQYAALMPAHWEAYRQNILATLAAAHPEA